jgi:hypothetical protein
LEVVVVDGVEGDVDPAGVPGDGVGVLLDRGAIGRVELGDLDPSLGFGDAGCDLLERPAGASDQVDRRAFGGKRAGDRRADRSGTAVDDRDLVLEQHHGSFGGADGALPDAKRANHRQGS